MGGRHDRNFGLCQLETAFFDTSQGRDRLKWLCCRSEELRSRLVTAGMNDTIPTHDAPTPPMLRFNEMPAPNARDEGASKCRLHACKANGAAQRKPTRGGCLGSERSDA